MWNKKETEIHFSKTSDILWKRVLNAKIVGNLDKYTKKYNLY